MATGATRASRDVAPQLDRDWLRGLVEALTSIRRAGADLVFTYWAKEFASWL